MFNVRDSDNIQESPFLHVVGVVWLKLLSGFVRRNLCNNGECHVTNSSVKCGQVDFSLRQQQSGDMLVLSDRRIQGIITLSIRLVRKLSFICHNEVYL